MTHVGIYWEIETEPQATFHYVSILSLQYRFSTIQNKTVHCNILNGAVGSMHCSEATNSSEAAGTDRTGECVPGVQGLIIFCAYLLMFFICYI